jgi:tetratricopeptide (TPR) repeat protein
MAGDVDFLLNPRGSLSAFLKNGAAFQRMGDYESAIENFTSAIEVETGNAEVYYGRGVSYYMACKLDQAIADLDRSIKIDPNFAAAYYARGSAFRDKGDVNRTIADYSRAVEIEPHNFTYVSSRGYAYFYKKDFPNSAADLARAVKGSGDGYCMMFLFLARTHLKQGSAAAELTANARMLEEKSWPRAAIDLLLGIGSPESTLAAAKGPDQAAEAYFYIGEWRLNRGDKAEAANDFRKVVETCPKHFIEYAVAAEHLRE